MTWSVRYGDPVFIVCGGPTAHGVLAMTYGRIAATERQGRSMPSSELVIFAPVREIGKEFLPHPNPLPRPRGRGDSHYLTSSHSDIGRFIFVRGAKQRSNLRGAEIGSLRSQ